MIEYKKIVKATGITEEELNRHGAEGWDNYAIVGNCFYFKRVIDEKPKTSVNNNHSGAKGRK